MTASALASTILAVGLTTGRAAAPATARVTPPSDAWQWPLTGTPVVSRPFQRPPHPWAAGHRGVDLAAAPGSTVLAAGAGVVNFAGYVAGVGVVAVLHPGGLRTTYEPVAPAVSPGSVLAAGQPIGRLLPGHGDCGPARWCLHWGLLRGSVYLDPLTLVRRGPVRLLPLAGAPPRLVAEAPAMAMANAATPAGLPPVGRPSEGLRSPTDQPKVTGAQTLARPVAAAAATASAALAGWLTRRRTSWVVGRLSPAGRRAWP